MHYRWDSGRVKENLGIRHLKMAQNFHNPNKHVLELCTQATQDVLENGHGTHASGFDVELWPRIKPTTEWDGNDIDSPFLSRDRRFIIRQIL
jgi:hypothetical protein